MANPMLQATTALLRYVREGERPGPPPNVSWLRPWGLDLSGQERGGSANHGLLGWTVEYARRESRVPDYLVHRLRWELQNGLMAHEQMSPTYGGLHLGCVCILWWVSWHRGDEEVNRLAGAWLERVLLLECLCGRIEQEGEGHRIHLLPPGMRADHRSVTEGRQVEEAIVGRLLGVPQDLRLDHSTWWGPLCDAVRQCKGLMKASARVRSPCLFLLENKSLRPSELYQVRLMVPMQFRTWPNGDWFASLAKSTGASQDPGCMGQGVIHGEHVFLWLWREGQDPPEEGWRSDCLMTPGGKSLHARWWHRGAPYGDQILDLPDGWTAEVIGAPSGPDPLGDLPPEMDPRQHPWRQGGKPEPPAEPEPRKPVDVPWDLGVLRENLEGIRDNDRARWKRVTAHRALATLDRLGAWEGLEE